MERKAFENFFEEQLNAIRNVCINKNREYARSEKDALANFKRRAEAMGLDPLTILQTDVYKHFDAINSFITRYRNDVAQVLNEPIQQRARDVMVYMVLFMGLVEDLAISAQVHIDESKEHPSDLLNYKQLVRDVTDAPSDKS